MLLEKLEQQNLVLIFDKLDNLPRKEVDTSKANIEFIMKELHKKHQEIYVIAAKVRKTEILNLALEHMIDVNFVPSGVIRGSDYDTSIYANKVVVYDNFFKGTTSEFNNTHRNISSIMDICQKFIGIQCISEYYMHHEYIDGTIRLLDPSFSGMNDYVEYEKFKKKYQKKYTELINREFIIIEDGKYSTVTDEIWATPESESGLYNKTTSNRNISITLDDEDTSKSNDNTFETESVDDRFEYVYLDFSNNETEPIYKHALRLVLCIYLGMFGVHKFYDKKIGIGLVYLFTFGLFGFGWLYDIIKLIVALVRAIINR